MSKTITSPVVEFPGTVVLNTAPNLVQVENFLEARFSKDLEQKERNRALFAAVCDLIETWQITGQPASPTNETFVAVPYIPARMLIEWLIGEITMLIAGERAIPNASGPGSSDTPKIPAETQNPQS